MVEKVWAKALGGDQMRQKPSTKASMQKKRHQNEIFNQEKSLIVFNQINQEHFGRGSGDFKTSQAGVETAA